MKLTCAACPGFVEFVERGETDGDQVHVLAERLLAPLQDAGVDTLLLGCTHYPYLARTIGDVMGRDVVLVSSADETAFSVADTLRDLDLVAGGRATGRGTSGSRRASWTRFRELGGQLLGPELDRARAISWDDPGLDAVDGVGLSITVLGCSGQLPGSGRGLQRLPRAGRRGQRRRRPRAGIAGQPPGAPRSGRPRRRRPHPWPSRPLDRSVRPAHRLEVRGSVARGCRCGAPPRAGRWPRS